MDALFDTDHFSILQEREQPACSNLERRLQATSNISIKTSIVSFQEQVRGRLAWIQRARKPTDILLGYYLLQGLLGHYAKLELLPFDAAALVEFDRLAVKRIRIGTRDLRIAAIAKVHGLKILTRNLRDFRQVSGLLCEDWTVP